MKPSDLTRSSDSSDYDGLGGYLVEDSALNKRICEVKEIKSVEETRNEFDSFQVNKRGREIVIKVVKR